MGQGIERKEIFYNDTDRRDFIDRLAAVLEDRDERSRICTPNQA